MFKKDSVDILDLPELHRKKLITLPERAESTISKSITKDGFYDISQNPTSQIQPNPSIEVKKEETNNVTNFLSDFASIGASNQQTTNAEANEDAKDLKWRLENLEFKLEQLIEKVNSLKNP